MTSQGTAHGRFTRAIATKNLREAEMAARELGQLGLDDALKLCVLLAERDPPRFERAALHWLERFIAERLPPIAEVAPRSVGARGASPQPPGSRSRQPRAARAAAA